jgi:beta-galactosidase
VAHLLPHWNWAKDTGNGREGEVTPVHLFTNGDEAELFVNGKSQGRIKKRLFEYRLRWDYVIYEPGEIRAVVYKDGKPWAEARRQTTGAARALTLEADRSVIDADGKDLSFVTLRIVDDKGETVPFAKETVTFTLEGPGEIVATDNGDPTDFTAFPSPTRKAFNGLALAIVRAKPGQKGLLSLRAQSEGLNSAHLAIAAH